MRVVLTDGAELSCKNFKAIESGVLLTKDKKRKKVIGFVPNREVRYVVPDDFEVDEPIEDDSADVAGDGETDLDRPGVLDVYGSNDESSAIDVETTPDRGADERTSHTDERTSHAAEETLPTDDVDLRRLGGLGATYADRLQVAGYRTLADIAAADPIAVAEAASVPLGRGRRWVNAAIQIRADALADDRANGADQEGNEAGSEEADTGEETHGEEGDGDVDESEDDEESEDDDSEDDEESEDDDSEDDEESEDDDSEDDEESEDDDGETDGDDRDQGGENDG